MKGVITKTKKQWKVLKHDEEVFSLQELENALYAMNRLDSGNYYIIDYLRERIITDTDSSWILGGYPKKVADAEGFKFLRRILNETELQWLQKVNEASYSVFFNDADDERKNLVLSCDLTSKTMRGEKLFHHKVTPFKMCHNGNLWLGLCKIFASHDPKMNYTACITDTKNNKKYDFIQDRFVLRDTDIVFTPEERQVLIWMIQKTTDSEISKRLNLTFDQFKHFKRKLYQKLDVEKSSEAIYMARMERII